MLGLYNPPLSIYSLFDHLSLFRSHLGEFGATGATGANPYILGAAMSATSNLHHLVVVDN